MPRPLSLLDWTCPAVFRIRFFASLTIMPFIYCLNTSTIQPVPLLDKIRLAGKHGFAAIELWLNDVFAYVEAGGQLHDVSRAVTDAGLFVPCTIAMKGWGDATEAEYPLALEECRRRMDLA